MLRLFVLTVLVSLLIGTAAGAWCRNHATNTSSLPRRRDAKDRGDLSVRRDISARKGNKLRLCATNQISPGESRF
jgi:hypothetical protein